MCIANMEGYLLDINPSFSRVLGYKDSQLRYRRMIDFVHPDDVDSTRQQIKVLNENRVLQGFQNRYRHALGHYITLEWSAYANFKDNKIYVIASDITEQKRLQSKLNQIEKALQAETLLLMTDSDGIITEVNEKLCQVSGYSREELLGRPHQLLNSERQSESFYQDFWHTIQSGKMWSGTLRNCSKSNSEYYLKSVTTPIYDTSDNIISYLSIGQDVSENFHYAAELNRVLAVLNETSRIAKVGGWELNISSGELTWTDETFEIMEMEKTPDHKATFPDAFDMFVPEHQTIVEEATSRVMEQGKAYNLEVKAVTAKGRELWVKTTGKANYQDGKLVSLSGIIQDIDAAKKAKFEYELERQKSVHHAKLASLGELAASVAHEINNPLGIISGYTEMLQDLYPGQGSMQQKLDAISRSVDRIAHIVRSLKKYSQTDKTSPPSRLLLRNVYEEAITLVGPKLRRYDVHFESDIQCDGLIEGNEIELEQVLINLLNNALDAVADLDAKWVKVTLAETENHIIVTISDSGPGVPKELKERIFEPFFTSKPNGEGTGLGLSIVRGILMEHQATISLDSESPHTCFKLSFLKLVDSN